MSEHLPLCQAFLGGAPAPVTWSPSPRLEEALRAIIAAGAAARPGLSLPDETFAAYLGERLTQEDAERGAEQYGRGLAAADLYLAAACLLGQPRAVELLEREVISRVPALVGHMNQAESWVAELQQDLWEDLLVSGPERRAKLYQYRGHGSLSGWFGSVTIRAALNRLSRAAPRTEPLEENDTAHMLPPDDPDAALLRRRHGALFEDALRQSFAALVPEQRNMLRMYYSGKLTVTQLAALFHVHHSTVVRTLASARGAVFSGVRRILQERLGVDSAEFRSLVRVALDGLDLSLSGLLRTG